MLKKKIYFIILILLTFASLSFADTIYLKNGNKITGIITKETEESVEIKINIGAVVTFSKKDIEKIEKESDQRHTKMEGSWETEKAKRDVRAISDSDIGEGEWEEGLVEYKGRWVAPEVKERLQAASIAQDIDKTEKERKFSSRQDKEKRSSFAEKLLDKGDWYVRETEHFSIYYEDQASSKIVSDKAEYYFEKIAYDLGYEKEIKWDKKCQVYIVEDIGGWKKFLKGIGFDPELIGGFVPNYEEKEMFLCVLSNEYLAVTFPHELTHLIFRDIAGKNTIPLWLNEGLANYEATATSISNKLLIKYIKQAKHILLGDLLRMSNYPEGKAMRELFYAQSEKMVEFLIVKYNREKFRKFCDFLVLKDKSFRESLLKAYSGDFEGLEDFNIKLVEYIVE